MTLIRELLEQYSETGDPALDQQARDLRKRNAGNPDAAERAIDRATRDRLRQVSGRMRALMQRKQQMNKQLDHQIEQERSREGMQR